LHSSNFCGDKCDDDIGGAASGGTVQSRRSGLCARVSCERQAIHSLRVCQQTQAHNACLEQLE
jgi:hypothetical protein